MKSSNKWLLGFGAALGILVILAVVLVLIMPGSDNIELLPENTPEGVVQRYLFAIKDRKYEEAYGYLSESAIEERGKYFSFDEWSRMIVNRDNERPWRANIGKAEYFGSKAVVTVTIEVFYPGGGLLRDPVSTWSYSFTLVQEDNAWKISSPLDITIIY